MADWFTVEAIDKDTFAISEYKHWEDLTPLPVMVVTTHIHWDHIGGHKYFENIAVHEAEKDWLSVRFPIPLQVVKRNLMCKPCDFPKNFILDGYPYSRSFTGALLFL